MAGAREIRTKIKSVQNTAKVTGRDGRGQQDAPGAGPDEGLAPLRAPDAPGDRPPRARESGVQASVPGGTRDVKRVGYVVISTDRGLCGGLNANLFRKLLREIASTSRTGVEVDVVPDRAKAARSSGACKVNLVASRSRTWARSRSYPS